jgi:hypothetical protein
MDPHLSDLDIWAYIGIAVIESGRGPDMVGKFREAGGGVFVKEEDWIAEKHCCCDGAKDEGKPVASGGGAIAIESSSERVIGC